MQHKNITQKNAEITKDNIDMKTFKIEKARVEKEQDKRMVLWAV